MSLIQDNINDVGDKIDQSIDTFIEGVEKSQKGIFNRLLAVVKEVETTPDGMIKQTVMNLRLLGRIRKTIENEILTDAYRNRVDNFANQFPAIASLNNGYFKVIDKAFDPNRELYKEVVKNSINLTRASLLESGVDQNIINPIVNIVNDSVTGGSFYTDMVEELQLNILGDSERLGNLMRYSKQITTDAINQFNASYNETIAVDLGLEWFYYSGGKRSTSRPFCKRYAGKYFHKKEVEDFGKGKDLDGSNLCSGGFCQGRANGTNKSTILKYRGGYNCKHIFKPTDIDGVPKNVIKRNIDKGYYVDDQLQDKLKNIKPKEVKEVNKIISHDDFIKKSDIFLNKYVDSKTKFIIDRSRNFSNDNFIGAPITSLNSLYEGFNSVLPEFDIKLNGIGHAKSTRALGLYFPQVNAIGMQKTYLKNANRIAKETRDSFLKRQTKYIDDANRLINADKPYAGLEYTKNKLEKLKATKRWSISSESKDPIKSTAIHESYHAVDEKYRLAYITGSSQKQSPFSDNLRKYNVSKIDQYKVSEYAASNITELFAETGAAIKEGIDIPESIKKAFEETIKGIIR